MLAAEGPSVKSGCAGSDGDGDGAPPPFRERKDAYFTVPCKSATEDWSLFLTLGTPSAPASRQAKDRSYPQVSADVGICCCFNRVPLFAFSRCGNAPCSS